MFARPELSKGWPRPLSSSRRRHQGRSADDSDCPFQVVGKDMEAHFSRLRPQRGAAYLGLRDAIRGLLRDRTGVPKATVSRTYAPPDDEAHSSLVSSESPRSVTKSQMLTTAEHLKSAREAILG